MRCGGCAWSQSRPAVFSGTTAAGVAPPTINWLGADRDCIPDPVPNAARAVTMAAAMSNSFAFGGINASLIIRKA